MIAVRFDLTKIADGGSDVGDDRSDGGYASIEVGPNAEITGCDAHGEELFGYSTKEVLAQPLSFLLPLLNGSSDLTSVGDRSHAPAGHTTARRKDGSEITVLISVTAVHIDGVWVEVGGADPAAGRREAESQLRESAERYADATRIAKLGHWTYDEVGDRITFVSDELARIHGVSVREYMDMVVSTDADIRRVHPDDQEHFGKAIRDAQAKATPFDVEYRIIRNGGEVRYIREIGEPIVDEAGRLVQSRGTLQDITERRLREEELAESEAKFRHAERIANLINWHTAADEFSTWLDVSDNAERLYGVPKEKLIGPFSIYSQIIHPADVDRVERQYRELNTRREPYELEYRVVRPNREVRWVREVGEPVTDDQGRPDGFRGTTQDVTYTKKIERDLETARVQAESASRAKTEFLANMSHELRTPLNSIIGFSELMRGEIYGDLGDARYLEYMNDIGFSAQHLLSLITDILDISKIEAGSFELEEMDFAPSDLVENCLSIVRPRAIRKRITVAADLPETLPWIHADSRMMRQVLLNILSNAIKFTPERGRIVVAASQRKDGAVMVVISDTGIGIAPENIAAALEPFTQVGGTAHEPNEGTGLGLAISKRMVEAHGGELSLESEVDHGTKVRIVLPPERTLKSEPGIDADA